MPRFGSSLASLPQLPNALLLQGGRRLQVALRHMHAKGLVHADVKSSNCLIDVEGRWYLADFGSSIPIGDKVLSSTETWSPESIVGQIAYERHDWALLLVLLAVELDKTALEELVRDHPNHSRGGIQRVDQVLVLKRCKQRAKDPGLRALLHELAEMAEWPGAGSLAGPGG